MCSSNHTVPHTNNLVSKLLIGLIRGYILVISPMLGANCRYLPTCSSYTMTAISLHGPLKGGAMAIWRILRCNPFAQGGYDPVVADDTDQVDKPKLDETHKNAR